MQTQSTPPLAANLTKVEIMLRFFRCAVVSLMLTPTLSTAQDLSAGLDALTAGDYATALRELRPLAEQGDAMAQISLGVMYDDGLSVSQDDAEAVRWYRLAAEQGNARARFYLANKYDTGEGVRQDVAEALRLFHLAAEQGHVESQHNLARMYANGRGVTQEDAEAVRWYRLAAEQGNASAQTGLGVMYFEGRGVVQDYITGYMWLEIAAAKGLEVTRRNQTVAESLMTGEAIFEAQQRAQRCMASDYQDCD